MRIIAGIHRSRRLIAPEGEATRPTSDKLRGALFNILHSAGMIAGKRWLDLYAGSGAVSIEAISRGASGAVAVENGKNALEALTANRKTLQLTRELRVIESDVLKALRELEANSEVFDVVFLDPPYKDEPAYQQTLQVLSRSRVLLPGSIVIAEHDKRFDPGDAFGSLRRTRVHKVSDSVLSFYLLTDSV